MGNWKLFLFVFFILSTLSGEAQQLDTTWLRQYDRVPSANKVFISEINSNKYLIQQAENYYEINGAGDSIGGGILDTALGNFGPNLMEAHDGAIYAGNYGSNGPIVYKLDTNYHIIWSTSLNPVSNFGSGVTAIMVDSGNVYVSGSMASKNPFIAKLDSAGNIIWEKTFPQNTFSNLDNLTKLQDGNYLANGNVDDYPLAIKFNSQGDTLWTYSETLFISFNNSAAAERSNGNIILVMGNTLVELDAMGSRIDSSTSFNNYQAAFIEADTLYLFGAYNTQQFGGERYAFVETRDLNIDSTNAWLKILDTHPFADNIFSSVVRSPNGFIAAGKHRDSIDINNNTYNILAARFNDSYSSSHTHIAEYSQSLAFDQFYPNPASQRINITLNDVQEIILSNLTGAKVLSASKTKQIDVATVPAGVYMIHVRSHNTWHHSKVIIQH